MLDISSTLPKHIVIMVPKEDGSESACKVDVEYEWLPLKCTTCMSLGHATRLCPTVKPKQPAVSVYVPVTKQPGDVGKPVQVQPVMDSQQRVHSETKSVPITAGPPPEDQSDKGKAIVLYNAFDALNSLDNFAESSKLAALYRILMISAAVWNVRGLNRSDHQVALRNLIYENRLSLVGLLETRVSAANIVRVQRGLLPRWTWFVDYFAPGNRIWLAWDSDFVGIDILEVDVQFIHCRIQMHCIHTSVLMTFVYGVNDVGGRRLLWYNLSRISASGEWFTWHNCSRDARSLWKRLDWLLVNDCWLQTWPNSYYSSLNAQIQTILHLLCEGILLFLLNRIVGTAIFAVTRKLKALKSSFRALRQRKGDLSNNVKLAASFLETAQTLLAQDRLNTVFLHLEYYCRLILHLATKLEQHMLQQRAKLAWMKGGDQCSRIFFRKVARRRAAKRVFQIMTSTGDTLTDQQDVANEFVSFYQTLLGEEEGRQLLRHVTADEVKQAVFDIDETKAPGPDGYSSGFFKAVWPIVGREVTQAILDFFATCKLLKQVNATLLSLIPKVQQPTLVTEFRPISCCNVLYKVVTKIIVQRMSGLLSSLISPSQNAFVPGRSIGDNILLAQELFTGYN
ncbi:UNVERIFIED_CONTAM: hypothetical protein Slati_2461500 [Sesamum latifolium]|uniref:Reverse transcriptase domain-containing protein n=1 Tax=Sesamum latifolium TaxID=2727402 RepID=A0AAW2WHV6_9LAMI